MFILTALFLAATLILAPPSQAGPLGAGWAGEVWLVKSVKQPSGARHVDARPSEYTLVLTGSRGVRVAGNCSQRTGSTTERFRLDGEVPILRKVVADGLTCRISKESPDGKLVIEVYKENALVTRSSVDGPRSLVFISVN